MIAPRQAGILSKNLLWLRDLAAALSIDVIKAIAKVLLAPLFDRASGGGRIDGGSVCRRLSAFRLSGSGIPLIDLFFCSGCGLSHHTVVAGLAWRLAGSPGLS